MKNTGKNIWGKKMMPRGADVFAVLLYLFAPSFFCHRNRFARGSPTSDLVAAGPGSGLLADQAAHEVTQTAIKLS